MLANRNGDTAVMTTTTAMTVWATRDLTDCWTLAMLDEAAHENAQKH
jgi:heme-degrading monooxygenase HmoA